MNLTALSVLLILPSIFAEISIVISSAGGLSPWAIYYKGTNDDLISDQERTTFKLNDNQLKDAVKDYLGARPDDVYLHSPTPWNDLYKTYNWTQVYRILTIDNLSILGHLHVPVVVLSETFQNTGTKNETYNAEVTTQVENNLTSEWKTDGLLSVSQNIIYTFTYEPLTFNYNATWGKGISLSQTTTVGASNGISITVEPGQAVTADLTVTRVTEVFRINYKALLYGQVAVNYNDKYNDRQFWGPFIGDVMDAGGIGNSVPSSETIMIRYFTDPRIVVTNDETKEILYTIPCNEMK